MAVDGCQGEKSHPPLGMKPLGGCHTIVDSYTVYMGSATFTKGIINNKNQRRHESGKDIELKMVKTRLGFLPSQPVFSELIGVRAEL